MRRYLHMLTFSALFCAVAFAAAADSDFHRRWAVNEFLRAADVTAHIRILGVRTTDEMLDPGTGKAGYKMYEMTAEVVEGFRGIKPGNIVFSFSQEQPSEPPGSGEYIVGLENVAGHLKFDAVAWIEATPDLIQFARAGK
jgi:hypothetical protein